MKAAVVIVAVCAYGLLSALCVLVPSIMPLGTPVGFSLVGPPSLLIWGRGVLPLYFGISAVLLVLLLVALRFSDARFPAGIAAAVIWPLAGWLSAALSV